MNIIINGQTMQLIKVNTLNAFMVSDALGQYFCEQISEQSNEHQLAKKQPSFALALNGNFIGKDEYASTPVRPNDSLDILLPIQGG